MAERAGLPLEPEPVEFPEPTGIGDRLRTERQSQGMTVREIARRVGVSPSLISQIERGKVNPSVSTLWTLVTVLGLPMSELFSDAQPSQDISPTAAAGVPGPVTMPGERAVINLETGVRWERLTAGGDALVEFLSVVYPPGAASCDEDSLVRHGGKEYGYVTAGRLGVRVGFDEYELEAGMAISFDASAPHRLWAIGDQPAEAIWVVVGRHNDGRGPPL
jgi:transcriptional regulator with XRE-family HTH domain